MTAKKDAIDRAKKRPYRSPKLRVHGDLRVMTKGKGADKADGGKPATRGTGTPG